MIFKVLKWLVTSFSCRFIRSPRRPWLAALCVLSILAPMLVPLPTLAQAKRIYIRDAEIESIIHTLADPIFRAAGLNPADVTIRLVQDKSLNAFVAGGQHIFLHTGLIIKSKGPDALIGVIAHETGHIEGGHLSRTQKAVANAKTIQLIGTVLGAIAAISSGNPGAGSAIMMGGQRAGQRTFMKYSRTQESAADQAAMRLLDATGRSAKGLEGFLETLSGQEALSTRLQAPYLQSHPLSRERITTMLHHISISPWSNHKASKADVLAHARIVAKLYGYIEPLKKVLRRYPETDQSFAARYARAIAYYRKPDLERALTLTDKLIQGAPRDPYLYELKGQMLFEHGRAQEALTAYREAFRLAPKQQLIALELARVELETNDPALLDSAIEHFHAVIRLGGASRFTWRQLGIAFGRKGEMGNSALALAEAELRGGQLANAEYQANQALKRLPKTGSAHLHALDILAAIKSIRESRATKK